MKNDELKIFQPVYLNNSDNCALWHM
jgi:hypothetical protein